MFINPTVAAVTEATPDYASGDVCGGVMAFSMRTPGGGGIIRRLGIKSLDAVGVASALYLFKDNPASSTVVENGTLAVHADDRAKIIDVVDIASADFITRTVAGLYVASKTLAIPFKFESSIRSVYAIFTPLGALNLSTVASLEFQLGAEVD